MVEMVVCGVINHFGEPAFDTLPVTQDQLSRLDGIGSGWHALVSDLAAEYEVDVQGSSGKLSLDLCRIRYPLHLRH